MAITGPSSPYAPWFITALPTGLLSMPPSLRMGSSVPRAVEHKEGDGDGDLGVQDPGRPEDEDHQQRRTQADQPGDERSSPGAAGELVHLDLVAGQQEEHAQ